MLGCALTHYAEKNRPLLPEVALFPLFEDVSYFTRQSCVLHVTSAMSDFTVKLLLFNKYNMVLKRHNISVREPSFPSTCIDRAHLEISSLVTRTNGRFKHL